VLRKEKRHYDIFLIAKDFKIFNKDKRDLFLAGYDESEDLAFLEVDAAAEEPSESCEGTESKG